MVNIAEVFDELISLMDPQLVICPYCGGCQTEIACWINDEKEEHVTSVYVKCRGCKARGPSAKVLKEIAGPDGANRLRITVEQAVGGWNRRQGERR